MTEPMKHKLSDALKGQAPEDPGQPPPKGPPVDRGPGTNPDVAAEQERREPDADPQHVTREQRLIDTGRAHDTHG